LTAASTGRKLADPCCTCLDLWRGHNTNDATEITHDHDRQTVYAREFEILIKILRAMVSDSMLSRMKRLTILAQGKI
jgi:hypothetical protein